MVEVKNFHFLKRPLLTKKGRWFFVTLRGGGGQSKCDICHKTFGFFFKASLSPLFAISHKMSDNFINCVLYIHLR